MSRLFAAPGSGDRCMVGSSPISAYPFSAFAWVRPAAQTDGVDDRCLSSLAVSSVANQFYGFAISTTGAAIVQARNTTYITGATTRLVDGAAWNAVGAEWVSATDRSVHLARLSDTTIDSGTSATSVLLGVVNRLAIGHLGDSTPNQEANGAIAHVAWWSVQLSAAEWQMLLLGRVSPRAVRPQSLVFYSPFLGRNSPEIDIVGARTLTLTATTSSAEEPPMLWLPRRRIIVPGVTLEQGTTRWRADDGSESAAGWLEAEDTGIERAKATNARLRLSVRRTI